MSFDFHTIRPYFPALKSGNIFFDNPGGTQVVQHTVDRVSRYLVETNANHGGVFKTSQASDAVIDTARAACADFYHAASPDEIVFGANMTTLTFALSRAIARTWEPGDTIVVTRLDHDANITPWTMAAADRGVQVEWVDVDIEDGTLNLESLSAALAKKPRLVAVGYASNALGTINPVKQIIHMAHEAGAWVYVDAVQYAPHGPIDVQDLDCEFLVSSAYKFFSTHVGVLYGKLSLLNDLTAYKVRPSPKMPPGKFETGTGNFEGIAGVLGALEYLEWLGAQAGALSPTASRRARLEQAMHAIQYYELSLSRALLETLAQVPGLHVYGLTDTARAAERVPTVSFNLAGWEPEKLAAYLAQENISVWNGNYYALAISERLGVEATGGMVRVGAVHYNTLAEIERLGAALQKAAR